LLNLASVIIAVLKIQHLALVLLEPVFVASYPIALIMHRGECNNVMFLLERYYKQFEKVMLIARINVGRMEHVEYAIKVAMHQ
jgi:hypothetical protein